MGVAAFPLLAKAAIPLVLGAGMQMYNTNQTNKRLDRETARGLMAQQAKQRDADRRVNETIQATAASNPEDEKASAMAQYKQALAANAGNIGGPAVPTGGASDRFAADQLAAALGVSEYGKELAGLMSRIDAPKTQRMGEANMRADAMTDIGVIKRKSAGEEFLTNLRLKGIRRNPWLDAIGQGLSAYGGGQASAALAGGGGTSFMGGAGTGDTSFMGDLWGTG